MVGGDQDPVIEQRQLAVGVARGGDDLPAVEAVAVVDELGVEGRPDERPEELALGEQLLGDMVGDAVAPEPDGEVRTTPRSSTSSPTARRRARPCTTRAPVRSRTSAEAPR